jgi:hypothetical protein
MVTPRTLLKWLIAIAPPRRGSRCSDGRHDLRARVRERRPMARWAPIRSAFDRC